MWPDKSNSGNQSFRFTVTPDYFRSNAIPSGSGMRFSRIEIRQIAISVLVLTIAFAIVLTGDISIVAAYPFFFAIMLGAAFVAVLTGFLLHELMHKRMAQSYGCFAEYRMNLMGLFLALVTSLIGFLFALPGAVVVSGRITVEQNGKISLAGPAMNMLVGGVFLVLSLSVYVDPIVNLVFYTVAFVNIWLALFNLLPISPLDGSKVLFWNKPVYILAMAAAVALFVINYIL